MRFIKGSGWKAFFDEENGRYFGEHGGGQYYDLFELTQEQYGMLDGKMSESEASSVMREGRHLYMSVNDRCGPPYTVVFDDDYKELCPWANAAGGGRVWSGELTDAAVELLGSEENNREQRRRKRAERERKGS